MGDRKGWRVGASPTESGGHLDAEGSGSLITSVSRMCPTPACLLPATRFATLVCALAVTVSAGSPAALAQDDGSLDPAFGGGVVFPGAVSTYGAVHAALTLEDGVLLAGRDGTEAVLIKLGRDGERVETFGVDGRTATALAGAALSWNAVALLPDGRLIAAGQSLEPEGTPTAVAARFSPDGLLDADFGEDGLRTMPELGGAASVVAVLPTGDVGYLIVGGRWRGTTGNAAPPEPGTPWDIPPAPVQTVVARFSVDGELDVGYGDGGTATLGISGRSVAATDAALLSDGSVVVVGEVGTPGSTFFGDWFAARVDADGTQDDAFAIRQFDFGGSLEFATSVAVDGAGRIVVAGALATQFANRLTFARLLPTGDLDPAFGAAGIAAFPDPDVGFFVLANDLEVSSEGAVTFVGSRSDSYVTSDVLLGRLRPDGTLDPTYGEGGIRSLGIQPGDIAFALAPDIDGGYFVAGAATTNDYTESFPFALRLAGPVTTDAERPSRLEQLTLRGPQPNPVSRVGRFAFALASPRDVRVDVVDVLGRVVRTVELGRRTAGEHAVDIDVGGLRPGVYVAVLRTGAGMTTRPFTVTR